MIELTKNRTRTMKVFDKDNGERLYRCHIGNIHYPDPSKLWQDIDTTLLSQTGGVYQDKCFYHCEVPEKADGTFRFYNRDHHFDLKLVGVSSVGRTPLPGIWGDLGKGYRYKDAFGSGIHFEVIAANMQFEKRICFEKPPSNVNQDFVFEYEIIDAPNRFDFKDTITGSATIIDPSESSLQAVSIENKITSIYSSTGKYKSLIHFPKCYDSNLNNKLRLPVKILFYTSSGKTYLRKIIPKEIFKNAVYPIYADDPVRYDPPAGDGWSAEVLSTWNATHDSLTASAYTTYTDDVNESYTYDTGSEYHIARLFVPIDTSGITDSDTVTAAILKLYVTGKTDDDGDAQSYNTVVGATSQSSVDSLAAADYDQCGAVDDPTKWSQDYDITNITISAYNDWTFDATGRSNVNKTGHTMIGVREGHDIEDIVVTGGISRIKCRDSSHTGTTEDPYLDVTTAAGGLSIPIASYYQIQHNQ